MTHTAINAISFSYYFKSRRPTISQASGMILQFVSRQTWSCPSNFHYNPIICPRHQFEKFISARV